MAKFMYKYVRQEKEMKEGQPKNFSENLKKWAIRGAIVARILGIIAVLAV